MAATQLTESRIKALRPRKTAHDIQNSSIRACSESRGVASRHGILSGSETDMEGTMPWTETTQLKYRRSDDFRQNM